MVTGPLRVILWILGSIGVLWLIVGLGSLAYMGRMMGDDSPMNGMDGSMMGGEGMLGMMSMMGTMVFQLIGMLGLVGIFVYLVIDTARRRPSAPRD